MDDDDVDDDDGDDDDGKNSAMFQSKKLIHIMRDQYFRE